MLLDDSFCFQTSAELSSNEVTDSATLNRSSYYARNIIYILAKKYKNMKVIVQITINVNKGREDDNTHVPKIHNIANNKSPPAIAEPP